NIACLSPGGEGEGLPRSLKSPQPCDNTCARRARELTCSFLAIGVVQGTPEDLAWEGAGVLAAFQQYLTIDQHVIDADRLPLHAPTAVRQVVYGLPRLRRNGLGIEDDDIRSLPRGKKAAVLQVMHQGRLARQPVDCVFQGHDLLLPHPVAEQTCAVFIAVHRIW